MSELFSWEVSFVVHPSVRIKVSFGLYALRIEIGASPEKKQDTRQLPPRQDGNHINHTVSWADAV
jgi:hypothetical protein